MVPQLAAAASAAHAPVLAINAAIEALGGTPTESPTAIIEKGRRMMPVEAIEYFRGHQQGATGWSRDDRRYFFDAFAGKVRAADGEEAALPYRAASLLADPSPDTAAWSSFPGEARSPQTAARLAQQHPLPSD